MIDWGALAARVVWALAVFMFGMAARWSWQYVFSESAYGWDGFHTTYTNPWAMGFAIVGVLTSCIAGLFALAFLVCVAGDIITALWAPFAAALSRPIRKRNRDKPEAF